MPLCSGETEGKYLSGKTGGGGKGGGGGGSNTDGDYQLVQHEVKKKTALLQIHILTRTNCQ